MDITNIPRYNYDKRHWKKIYGIEEANKLGELLTGIPAGEIVQKQNQKPTVRVRCLALNHKNIYHLLLIPDISPLSLGQD